MKELRVAQSAGFCFGVNRSVGMAEKLLEDKGKCASLGQLIHNEDVVRELTAKGLRVIERADEARPGEDVLIRAHGAAPEVYEELQKAGAVIHDATCPKVKAIHKIVTAAKEKNRFTVVIGMRNHPEVEAICGWCGEHKVLENAAELEQWLDENPGYWEKPITLVVQTTQTNSNFTECCNVIKKRCTNPEISDTICLATSTRQEEAARLASDCDAMVVIGGRHSANSVHLAEICREHCPCVEFIERADALDMDRLKTADTVGLTAGASTPAWIIKEVRNKMSDEIKVEESAVEVEKSFDEMLEETLKTIYNGDKVTGHVVAITGTEISVDLGTKYSGFIPTSEFTDDGVKVEDVVKVGDTIEAVVVRVNDVEGTVMLSKKRLDAAKSWNDIEEAAESGAVLEGVVSGENKGGVVVNVKGVSVFVPASQTDLPREAELSQLIKKTVRLKITEVNKARKRVVGSIRRVAQAERRERIESIWNEIEVGKKYHGTVKSLTSYGAFVDIGGIDGMVHVSELSWGRIHQPSEVLSVGDGAFRKKSGNKMKEILGAGVTGILVSHSISQVREMCNKILWIDHGKQIVFSDDVKYYCDAYEEFLATKKLPGSDEEMDELVKGHLKRVQREKEEKARTEAQKLQAVLESGTSSAAIEAALGIIRKSRPELLNPEITDLMVNEEESI